MILVDDVLVRRAHAPRARQEESRSGLLARRRQESLTTAITAAELVDGRRLPAGRRKERLGDAVRGLIEEDFDGRVEPFDAAAAIHYADLQRLRVAVVRWSAADAQIVAICRKLRATLATRTTSDFAGCRESILLDPWQL